MTKRTGKLFLINFFPLERNDHQNFIPNINNNNFNYIILIIIIILFELNLLLKTKITIFKNKK